MRIVDSAPALAEALERPRSGTAIGLVPTMGSLHEGHLSLIRMAAAECSNVVASVFVNPTQFGEAQDIDRYPRQLDRDAELAASAGADMIFAPTVDYMYPDGFETWVEVTDTARGLEGDARLGHFRGVATVCLKLFNLVAPDIVYFGWKDAQQTAVIHRMIRDLDLTLTLRLGATVREPDGLAMSSRNAQLSTAERERASLLPRALTAGVAAYTDGDDPSDAALAVLATDDAIEVDYVQQMTAHDHRLLCAAVRIGTTRLIDNVILEEPA